jgi:hypothetical protein
MKQILVSLALPLLLTAGLAQRADAGGRVVVRRTVTHGHAHCGCPVQLQRHIAGHDHCGRPVFRVRTLPVRHRCQPAVVQRHPTRCAPTRYAPTRYAPTRCTPTRYAPACPPRATQYRSNGQLYRAIPASPLPRVNFSSGRSIHVGLGLR